MSRFDRYELGAWNAVCSMCGRKRKNTYLVRNWQGMWRCPEHNEPRHPQDFVRTPPDAMLPPWVQARPHGIPVSICTPASVSSLAGTASPGCWLIGFVSPAYDPAINYGLPIL